MNSARWKTAVVALLSFAAGSLATRQFLSTGGKPEADHDGKPAAVQADAGHAEEPKGGKLSPEVVKNLGLEFATVSAERVPAEVRAYGRVLDPSPLASLVVEQATAGVAFEASSKELERVRTLHAQGQIASDRVLQSAQAAARRDQLLVESTRLRMASGWGDALGSRADLGELVHRLAAQKAAVVRIDLPLGVAADGEPTSARVAALGDDTRFSPVVLLGPAPVVDPQLQGRGHLALLEGRVLPPGTVLTAWLGVGGDPVPQVLVPRDALLRHEGGVFVEVKRGEGEFERRAVELDRPWKDGWLLESGLKAGETVVTRGAQQLLSAELKGSAAD